MLSLLNSLAVRRGGNGKLAQSSIWKQFSSAVQTTADATVTTTTSNESASALTEQTTSLDKPDNSRYPNAPIRKFFEEHIVPMKQDQTPGRIPFGRPWFASELRIKSFEDLHKLHFTLLIERNKLLNEKVRHRKHNLLFPSPERLRNVRLSMARLQTVLHERAIESNELKVMQAVNELQSGQVPEKPPRTEAQERWFRVHQMLKKPQQHRPTPIRASGGQKTREKLLKAKEFEEDTMTYIAEIEKSRERVVEEVADETKRYTTKADIGNPIEKPRWRNLNTDAQMQLKEKQTMTKVQKLIRARIQSQTMSKKKSSSQTDVEMENLKQQRPKWADRPELGKLFLRREKTNTGVRRSVKGKRSQQEKL
jgi:large subunit ribosomal protein L47